MPEDHDRFGAEHRDPVFEAGDDRRCRDVPGNPRHEHMADALIEDELDRHPRIRAGQHGGERLLFFDGFRLQYVEVF